MKIILGSSSPFRRKILEDAGVTFEVLSPDIDEKKIRTTDPLHTPVVLSYAKAMAVAEKIKEPAIIIASDQVIFCDGKILEKPDSVEEIYEWFKLYEKHPVNYVSGVTVFNTETGACLTAQDIVVGEFKEVPREFIDEQIKVGDMLICCGAISGKIADEYSVIVQGTHDSMVGLPIELVMEMIEKIK